MANLAQRRWRDEDWGADGRYHESGLILTGNAGNHDYVAKSLHNVQALEASATAHGHPVKRPVEVLATGEDIKRVIRTGGTSGDTGYVNWNSGWVDAEASIVFLHKKLQSIGRVQFMTATVTNLLFDSSQDLVLGAQLDSGENIRADLTIVAAGAWTPSLLDMRGIATSTGHVLGYTNLSSVDKNQLADIPVLLNISNGMFCIPPDNYNVLKVARHAYGYLNPTTIRNPEPHASQDKYITVSLPPINPPERLPLEGLRALYQFQHRVFPKLPFSFFDKTRICWYTDTPTGDWIIDYHPSYSKSLFVAAGGSGHAFKFLPVIGGKIVQHILGGLELEYIELWKWPVDRLDYSEWQGDGSRSGRKGMILEEELKVGETPKL